MKSTAKNQQQQIFNYARRKGAERNFKNALRIFQSIEPDETDFDYINAFTDFSLAEDALIELGYSTEQIMKLVDEAAA